MQFDTPTAIAYAEAGRLDEWVRAYLTTGGWANWGLADGLRLQRRWWRGPLLLPLGQLVRCCGPEPEMEYRIDAADWAAATQAMAAALTTPEALPPLIAEYRSGLLSVRDGNKRHAAMQLRGWPAAWTLIWYNSRADYGAVRT